MSNRTQMKLSDNVLEMKFMKKSKEKAQLEAENEEENEMYAEDLKKVNTRKYTKFVEVNLATCINAIDGRISMKGMNPKIESLMNEDYTKKLDEVEKRKEKEVSDVDMANNLNPLSKTIDKKFKNKHKKQKTGS